MKYKIFFMVLLIFSIATGAMAGTIHYRILGETVPQLNGEKVMLFQFKGTRVNVSHVDTTVIANGRFFFEGKLDTCKFAIISCGNYPDTVRATKLMLENGEIKVFLDKRSKIGGTPLNDLYQPFLVEYNSVNDSLAAIGNKTETDSLAQTENEKKRYAYQRELWASEMTFIKSNINNTLGKALFMQKYAIIDVYDKGSFNEIYDKADPQLKSNPDIIKYLDWREKAEKTEKKRLLQQAQQTKLTGTKYTDFTFLTLSGEKQRISDYVGKSKFLLLEFWASWCNPCMLEQPLIKEIYTKYKSKGLEVLGISLDENDKLWKNAINKIQMTWPQLRDLKEGHSGIKKAYNFISIPHITLIDQQGHIVISDLRGEALNELLSKLFKDVPKISKE